MDVTRSYQHTCTVDMDVTRSYQHVLPILT